nr:hypothetical protein [Alistipes sp.]
RDGDPKPLRPSFYTDNFLSLMPGESRTVRIETALDKLPEATYTLVVRGFNLDTREFQVKIRRP